MRPALSRISILLFVVFLAGIVDIILYLTFDSRADMVRTLPGQTREVVSKLPDSVENINVLPRVDDENKDAERVALLNDKVLTYRADTPDISVTFQELRGRVWRGKFSFGESTPVGRHVVLVLPREIYHPGPEDAAASKITVAVFANAGEMRRSYTSLTERYLGVGPWWVVVSIIPLAALLLLHTYRQAGVEVARLQAMGLGPIYKLAKKKDAWEVVFGLGSRHGVQEGEHLSLLGPDRRPVGTVMARRVWTETAEAQVPLDADVSPYHFVAKTDARRD